MKKFIYLLIVFLLLIVLCLFGCDTSENTVEPEKATVESVEVVGTTEQNNNFDGMVVTVNGTAFSLEDIKSGIENAFNEQLYYHGDYDSNYILTNKNIVLGKDIEYDLYLNEATEYSLPMIDIHIKNVEHYLSTLEEPLFYTMSIFVAENGIFTDFYRCGPISKYHIVTDSNCVYLGQHSMRIGEVVQPVYDEIGADWQKKAKSAIQLYMNRNDFMGEGRSEGEGAVETSFKQGIYNVYVKKFSATDTDTDIIFEHENGSIYEAKFCFVHDITEGQVANLRLIFYFSMIEDAGHISFINKVKNDPAVSFEYTIK